MSGNFNLYKYIFHLFLSGQAPCNQLLPSGLGLVFSFFTQRIRQETKARSKLTTLKSSLCLKHYKFRSIVFNMRINWIIISYKRYLLVHKNIIKSRAMPDEYVTDFRNRHLALNWSHKSSLNRQLSGPSVHLLYNIVQFIHDVRKYQSRV